MSVDRPKSLSVTNPTFLKTSEEIKVSLFDNPESSLLSRILFVLKIGVAIVIQPLGFTLISMLIFRSISKFVSEQGIGNREAKEIDLDLRQALHKLPGKDIRFGFKGKAVLEGMYFETTKSDNPKTVLLCSGSHKSFEHYTVPMVRELMDKGFNVMVFNYEGFGKSEGVICEDGIYRSVEAAYTYLKKEKKLSDDQIIAWGYSLGSGAVSNLAQSHKVDVVIDRGFSSMDVVAYTAAPSHLKTAAKVMFSSAAKFDNISKLKNAKGRILVAQGNKDDTMLAELHGLKLQSALRSNPNFYYLIVSSYHQHENTFWFSKTGEEQRQVLDYLSSKASDTSK